MSRKKLILILGVFCLLQMMGCDRHREQIETAKAAAETPKPAATQDAEPTTQALLSGKTKKLRLPGGPLIAVVPESWKLDTDGPVTFVTGPSLFGTATVGLSSPSSVSFKQQEIDALIAKLPAELQTHPEQYRREVHRTIGNLQVIEHRYLKKPMTRNKTDAKGDPVPDAQGGFATITATPVQWTLTVFVPGEQAFTRYELNLIDLEADQLAVDEPLLDKIMHSVTVDGVASISAATTAP